MKYSFDWNASKESINRRKHGVSFRQAATIFRDPRQIVIYDEKHSRDEDRWTTLGIDSIGTVRVVVHTFEYITKELCRVRIISARKATKLEILQYHQGSDE